MKIFDSALHKKVDFIELKKGHVRIYVCGPTVYDYSHLGHARSAISFDILVRILRLSGYEVIFVKNFTDIDDKIIAKALQNKECINEVSSRFIQSYLDEMNALNVLSPDIAPRATDFIDNMADFVQYLLDNNLAYKLENNDIYLDVSKDEKYGLLSNQIGEELLSRIENENKKDSKDFALWKSYKGENDVGYDSILGKGRPGWHLECSSMIDSVLAYKDTPYSIDIHGGGSDLFFPHHENEACQSRLYTKKEIAKYWMHNGFVNINGEKMSKSLGNSFYIKDALAHYHPEILRNYLLGVHYRAILHFNEEDLINSKKRLDKIYRLKKRVNFINENINDFSIKCESDFAREFLECMQDDLNISMALSVIEDFIKTSNESLDKNHKDKNLINEIKMNLKIIDVALGLGQLNYRQYFQLGISEEFKKEIESLIKERLEFKKNKDYANADKIRAKLENDGIILMDKGSDLTEWESAN